MDKDTSDGAMRMYFIYFILACVILFGAGCFAGVVAGINSGDVKTNILGNKSLICYTGIDGDYLFNIDPSGNEYLIKYDKSSFILDKEYVERCRKAIRQGCNMVDIKLSSNNSSTIAITSYSPTVNSFETQLWSNRYKMELGRQ